MYSSLLRRTAVLPSIYDHYSQLDVVTQDPALRDERAWDFEEIFDPAAISRFTKVSVVSLAGRVFLNVLERCVCCFQMYIQIYGCI